MLRLGIVGRQAWTWRALIFEETSNSTTSGAETGIATSIKLLFRLVFPGAILAATLVPGLHALLRALGLNIKFVYLFPIEVITWGWVIVVSDMRIYMLFEGRRYWPSPIRKLLIWCQRLRLKRLSKIVFNPPPPKRTAVGSRKLVLNTGFIQSTDREAYVSAPTRLGNIIESFENYPDVKYGLDSVFYWYRLWVVLDKDLREEIDSALCRDL